MSGKVTIEQRLSNIKNKNNRVVVKKFVSHLKSDGRTEARIEKYCWILAKISDWLGKDFKKANDNDIRKVVIKIEGSDYTPWTKHDYKAVIKTFYKWFEGDNAEMPKKVRWIKTSVKDKSTVSPSDVLTREEIIKIIESASSLRNKAFVAILYETGVRIGEMLGMKIKDIEINEMMVSISVSGKTGQRTVFVRGFRKYLIDWLNSHPHKKDRESYVWIENNKDKPISHSRVCDLLKRTARKAGLQEQRANKIHPHLFRHSLATHLASKLTEQEMKALFGWTASSEMAAIYCHLSAHDIKNSVASKVYGLTNGEIKQKEEALMPKICDVCNRENPADARFCNCGSILDIKTAIEVDQKLRDARFVEGQLSGNVLNMYAQLKDLERRFKVLAVESKKK